MKQVTSRPRSGKTTYHRTGWVTLWDCVSEQWVTINELDDELSAALSEPERARIIRHLHPERRGTEDAPARRLVRSAPRYHKGGKIVTAYTREGLDRLYGTISRAYEMVPDGLEDEGSCMLGAGVYVWFLRPRARAATPIRIVSPHYQGNVTIRRICEPIVKMLKAEGVLGVHYSDGTMD